MVRVSEEEIDRLLEPIEAPGPPPDDEQKGVAALRATMNALREEVHAEDIELLERLIAEGEQPADWSTPIA